MKTKKKLPFDKYDFYKKAVQSPDEDVQFYQDRYQGLRGRKKKATVLREDFCGTGSISVEWVKLNKKNRSYGLDLDKEPMEYGKKKYISKLTPEQKSRIQLINKNVLNPNVPKADIVAAVNFSYFLFKERDLLRKYFVNVLKSLKKDGIFIVDIFGGTHCTDAVVDKTRRKGFTYIWDQKSFDPYSNFAEFGIHFKYKKRIYKDIFTYDWRMWSIPEIKEIMIEAGFKSTEVFWEGSDRNGNGNGKFDRIEKGEACLSWIAYIVGVK